MWGFRPVGSRHTLSSPFGFVTLTKEFSHSVTSFLSNLVRTSFVTKLSNSSWNCFLIAMGTHLQGFHTGIAPSFRFILTGSTFSFPRPENTSLYLLRMVCLDKLVSTLSKLSFASQSFFKGISKESNFMLVKSGRSKIG